MNVLLRKERDKYVIFHIWSDQSKMLDVSGFIIVFTHFKN